MIGIYLINLGTPDAPTTEAVGRYLREFLSDPLVIDIPAFQRWLLVNAIIVPFRSPKSAAAYRKIWSAFGSPLLAHGRNLTWKLEEQLGDNYKVVLGMRYGSPSIAQGLLDLADMDLERIIVVPLYPQMAAASYESTRLKVNGLARAIELKVPVDFVPAFYDKDGFLAPFANTIDAVVKAQQPDHVLFSYHGLPVRQIKRMHPEHCLLANDCCERITDANRDCYRAQCVATTRSLVSRLNLTSHSMSFQSRLGRNAWIEPNTETELVRLAKAGVKKIAVACPAFVSDCLETLEEISIRAKELFLAHGGEDLRLVPSLNDRLDWVKGLGQIIDDFLNAKNHRKSE